LGTSDYLSDECARLDRALRWAAVHAWYSSDTGDKVCPQDVPQEWIDKLVQTWLRLADGKVGLS